jgi:proteasome lid subunit RPN8/RPN11
MEDFLHQEVLSVREHISRDFPKEICGVLGKNKKFTYYPCKNIASNTADEFVIDPKEYTGLSLKTNIVAIVHSHNGSCLPSQWDIKQCNNIGLPFVIYGTDGIYVQYPEKPRLKGRLYTFGKLDCFEAVRDWYLYKGLVFPPREDWVEDWGEKGLNYMEDLIPKWGFEKVHDNSLIYGDLLLFKVFSPVPDHIGVYEDNDKFFHHANNRASCSENLWSFWARFMVGVYRNDKASHLRG